MPAEPLTKTQDFGSVSRVQGILFHILTIGAAVLGVVALFLLLTLTALDAFEPATADGGWYLILLGAFLVPSVATLGYFIHDRAAGAIALRSLGAALAGTGLAVLLVLWLGGQLALLSMIGVVVPTIVHLNVLRQRKRAISVGLQTAGIVTAGLTVATLGALFFGAQATLVAAVAVGIPAATVSRYFMSNPAIGKTGVAATKVALLAALVTTISVEGAIFLLDASVGETVGVGLVAAAAALGGIAYGGSVVYRGGDNLLGVFTPFILIAGGLSGFLFHRSFVLTGPTPALLYGVLAGLPAIAYARGVIESRDEGQFGLTLPLVPAIGAAVVLLFHSNYVILAPNVVLTFGLAIGLFLGGAVWYVFENDLDGATGLLFPVVAGGGLLLGLVSADRLGFSGPDTWLDVAFLTSGSHYEPALAGIHPALIGSLYLMFVVTFVAFPVGIGAAIYLEEYAPDNRYTRFLEINIANLAGVPSVVYGLLGAAVFIRFGGLSLGAVVAGGFTLALLILPIVIISAQEALRSVPDSLRRASYGMGATQWQTVRNVVLPRALPGILTGAILSIGRAVGETAPLIMVGLVSISSVPSGLAGQGTAMPLQVFGWALGSKEAFRGHVAAAGAMTLLVVLLSMNAVAIIIRNKYQQEQ